MNNFFNHFSSVLLTTARLVLDLLAGSVALLANSARTTPSNDELSNSVRGGVMNHRTEKFDDGSDPAGWYERD